MTAPEVKLHVSAEDPSLVPAFGRQLKKLAALGDQAELVRVFFLFLLSCFIWACWFVMSRSFHNCCVCVPVCLLCVCSRMCGGGGRSSFTWCLMMWSVVVWAINNSGLLKS